LLKESKFNGYENANSWLRKGWTSSPLDLLLADYASTEKISDLPRRLDTAGAPPGFAPSAGDIAYYAPWGNLAVFHKDFAYSAGLVRLGKIDAGIALLRRPGTLRVMIEHIK
jgi:hypothetical protein